MSSLPETKEYKIYASREATGLRALICESQQQYWTQQQESHLK